MAKTKVYAEIGFNGQDIKIRSLVNEFEQLAYFDVNFVNDFGNVEYLSNGAIATIDWYYAKEQIEQWLDFEAELVGFALDTITDNFSYFIDIDTNYVFPEEAGYPENTIYIDLANSADCVLFENNCEEYVNSTISFETSDCNLKSLDGDYISIRDGVMVEVTFMTFYRPYKVVRSYLATITGTNEYTIMYDLVDKDGKKTTTSQEFITLLENTGL